MSDRNIPTRAATVISAAIQQLTELLAEEAAQQLHRATAYETDRERLIGSNHRAEPRPSLEASPHT